MKLQIAKSELQKGLGRIQAIVEKRNSMPILANVLIEAEKASGGGLLRLSATDLEVGVRGQHPAEVDKTGGLTVAAKKLFEIIRELPDESVALETTANSYLDLRCARSHFTLAGTSAEEYPTLPAFSPEATARVPAHALSAMIERTLYAASLDETRYNLNGVYLEVHGDTGKLRMVAKACVLIRMRREAEHRRSEPGDGRVDAGRKNRPDQHPARTRDGGARRDEKARPRAHDRQ